MLVVAAAAAVVRARPRPQPTASRPRPGSDLDLPPETRLWRAVLGRALSDASGHGMFVNAYSRGAVTRQARAWLSRPSPGRDLVLDHCGINPGWWQERLPLLEAWFERCDRGEERPVVS